MANPRLLRIAGLRQRYYNTVVIELNIPGRGTVRLLHLVCNVDGTLSLDGQLLEGLIRTLPDLRDRLTLHLLTADTYANQDLIDRQLNVRAIRIQPGDEPGQKVDYIRQLGAESVVAIGQGASDAGMLQEAQIGICVLSPEGTVVECLMAADLVVPNIQSAIDLLEKPLRLVASLRR